jgi:ribonuclease HII
VKRTFGADEAGRGPILGPMVVAVVALDRGGAIAMRKRGIADSKSFGAGDVAIRRRAELAAIVRERALCFAIRVLDVEEIDRHTYRGQLNALERMAVLDLLEETGCAADEKIVCDGAVLFSPLRVHYPNLLAVNHGEQAHASVAAASILAKDERDRAFAAIARRYEPEFGPIRGGGYLNAATHRFLDAYRERYGGLPPEARKSWGAPKADPTLPLAGC